MYSGHLLTSNFFSMPMPNVLVLIEQISTPPIFILHHLKKEGPGANTWMQKPTQFLVWGIPLPQRLLESKKVTWTTFQRKLENFENHWIRCLTGLCNEFNLNPYSFFTEKQSLSIFWTFCNPLVLRDAPAPKSSWFVHSCVGTRSLLH